MLVRFRRASVSEARGGVRATTLSGRHGRSAAGTGFIHGPLVWALVTGCGGGLPLLHPAQAIDPGQVRAAAGFSANVATGEFAEALRAATHPNATVAGEPDTAAAEGALAEASLAPGIAPWAAARVGIWESAEGGLTYTGRAVRADIRRVFKLSRTWSLSVGAAGSAVLSGRQAGGTVAGVDLGALRGWGADTPLLVGYSSDGDLYMAWLGARGGWEHVEAGGMQGEPGMPAPPFSISATRWWGGGLLGAAVGFRHIHVAMEIDASYANVTGSLAGTHAQVAGLMLTPAGCVWWDF